MEQYTQNTSAVKGEREKNEDGKHKIRFENNAGEEKEQKEPTRKIN